MAVAASRGTLETGGLDRDLAGGEMARYADILHARLGRCPTVAAAKAMVEELEAAVKEKRKRIKEGASRAEIEAAELRVQKAKEDVLERTGTLSNDEKVLAGHIGAAIFELRRTRAQGEAQVSIGEVVLPGRVARRHRRRPPERSKTMARRFGGGRAAPGQPGLPRPAG